MFIIANIRINQNQSVNGISLVHLEAHYISYCTPLVHIFFSAESMEENVMVLISKPIQD